MEQAVTDSEQFVYNVCQKSFLSLWSYVNPLGRDPGKELCDILIVCDPDVIVISVKGIALSNSGNVAVNWARWERRAVAGSIRQIEGAIRYLDKVTQVTKKDGTTGLPLPALNRRVYHRVAVACGGRGEVPITSSTESEKPMVHVFDEKSFFLILRNLDTVSDFVRYLADKENFLERAIALIDGGEENLLAAYLHAGRTFPKEGDFAIFHGDLWEGVSSRKEFLLKQERDRDSYIWDMLIESLCESGFDNATWIGPSMEESERALRVLAKENRFSRRMLGNALYDFLEQSKAGKVRARIAPARSEAVYVFLTSSADTAREDRKIELTARCFAALRRYPNATAVVGIGMNVPGEKPVDGFTTELVMLQKEGPSWPTDFLEWARTAQEELGYFKAPNITKVHEDEYPDDRTNLP
jgi:hypothetical protein